jgi:hypothetical protein
MKIFKKLFYKSYLILKLCFFVCSKAPSKVDPLLTSEADPVASILPEHQDLGVIPGGFVAQEYISMGHFLEGPRYVSETLQCR